MLSPRPKYNFLMFAIGRRILVTVHFVQSKQPTCLAPNRMMSMVLYAMLAPAMGVIARPVW